MRCSALIVAAGRGQRLDPRRPKQLLPLAGRPLLAWTIEAFTACPAIDELVLVVAADQLDAARALLAAASPAARATVCEGGATRGDSVLRGLARVAASAELVAIHDGARALVSPALIAAVVAAAAQHGSAIPCVVPADTVRSVDQTGRASGTIPRDGLRLVQTPQVFAAPLIRRAYAAFERLAPAQRATITDDAQLVERLGAPLQLVPGDPRNIKITLPGDLAVAAALLGDRSMTTPRCGIGYDVHAFGPGDAVILGGVSIPFARRLVGHSDADVLCHAVGDALLGAAALGDLGRHFPPEDARFAGASSLELLRAIRELLAHGGYRPWNVDATVVCEAPRIAPRAPAMCANLAAALGLAPEQVSVKGTTTEGLGFTGRGEGIAAYATAAIVGTPAAPRCRSAEGPAPG